MRKEGGDQSALVHIRMLLEQLHHTLDSLLGCLPRLEVNDHVQVESEALLDKLLHGWDGFG